MGAARSGGGTGGAAFLGALSLGPRACAFALFSSRRRHNFIPADDTATPFEAFAFASSAASPSAAFASPSAASASPSAGCAAFAFVRPWPNLLSRRFFTGPIAGASTSGAAASSGAVAGAAVACAPLVLRFFSAVPLSAAAFAAVAFFAAAALSAVASAGAAGCASLVAFFAFVALGVIGLPGCALADAPRLRVGFAPGGLAKVSAGEASMFLP